MRILVVGAGAVGSFLGATLAGAGAEVTLVDRRVPDAEPAPDTRQGAPLLGEPATLVVDGVGGRHEVAARRISSVADLVQQPDVALVAVKMFDIVTALESL